uniref:Uncharacterized protein n=1 Tax=Anopheles epiroticus TaxID=199890 RepID=A0A182PM01_9DIPT
MDQKYKTNSNELNVNQLATIIRNNANTSNNILQHLPRIEQSVAHINQNNKNIKEKLISNFEITDIKKWAKNFRINNKQPSAELHEEMLAVIDRAIELQKKFRLRDTQRLTVLALLANNSSTLAQVSTGEGKSLIVAATAIIQGLLGKCVDVVTSSSVLAKRDADVNKKLYELFGLNVSHNCTERLEDRKEAYSCNQILYGDLANFQRDYLLDRFFGKNILGNRNFETVIVDEVDSMLLDKGNNILYLSHDIAGMDKLESVYVFVWQMVNSPTDVPDDLHMESIKQSVLAEMYATVQKEDIESLDQNLGQSNIALIWHRLVKSQIINHAGRLLIQSIDCNMIHRAIAPEFTSYTDRLCFLLQSIIERETCFKVPNYLKPFVERHLDGWISSAFTALYMVTGQQYVVDVDRSGSSADRHANVIILDNDTGTDQANSQWDEALHQFLQLKHGCKLSIQSLKAVFISNVSFFKKYKSLYGLTGTLGSKIERDLLKQIHQVDFVTIPTAKSKQFEEYDPIICSSKEHWKQQIMQEVTELTNDQKRSVLIICETITEVETLQQMFHTNLQTNVYTYVRDYEKFTIAEGDKKLEPGHTIIATNLAGRGTDIKISDDLRNNGGLHVILTYLPMNNRIEEQAFGRAARSGDKGSGGMIIMASGDTVANNYLIFALKKKRDVDEQFRISAIKAYYETTIKTEEECFKTFEDVYNLQRKCLEAHKTPNSVKEILLKSCLDKWSFWLDENDSRIGKACDETSNREVTQLLNQFLEQLEKVQATNANCWATWVEGNPIQMIKLGKWISQHKPKHCDVALELFRKVIASEPYFCEAAYYYRAYARLVLDFNREGFKSDLRMAENLFDDHIKNEIYASGVISKLKLSTPQIEGYEEQKKSLINLYSLFIQSIDDMLGHAMTPQSFVNYEINEEVADIIFQDLVQNEDNPTSNGET